MTDIPNDTTPPPPDAGKLADRCENFMLGTKKLYDQPGATNGDMWFFELYHHLDDCAAALRADRAQTERERHEALERARKEGWDAAIVDRATPPVSEERLAAAIYEIFPLYQRGWPGTGERRSWGNLNCYRGSAVDETKPYYAAARAVLALIPQAGGWQPIETKD